MTTINIHNVVTMKLKAISAEGDTTWRDMLVTDKDGHTFVLCFFGEDIENLKLNLKEV